MRVYSALGRLITPARARAACPTDLQRVSRKHPQPYKSENATSPRFRTLSLDDSMPPTPPATASPPPCRRIGNTLRPQHLLSCMRAAAGCSPSCARAGWQRCCCCCCCRSSGLDCKTKQALTLRLPPRPHSDGNTARAAREANFGTHTCTGDRAAFAPLSTNSGAVRPAIQKFLACSEFILSHGLVQLYPLTRVLEYLFYSAEGSAVTLPALVGPVGGCNTPPRPI